MAHANIDQLLARHQVQRKVALSVPAFHVLPMLIPNSDLVASVPGMLAEAYASHFPINVFAMPVAIPPFDLRIYWHDHHDAPIRWLRNAFVELFGARRTARSKSIGPRRCTSSSAIEGRPDASGVSP
jgi:DNA-binding transcriptional LysR family regulator